LRCGAIVVAARFRDEGCEGEVSGRKGNFRFGSAIQQVIKIKTLTSDGKSKLKIDAISAS
jgi:hypothetical protein